MGSLDLLAAVVVVDTSLVCHGNLLGCCCCFLHSVYSFLLFTDGTLQLLRYLVMKWGICPFFFCYVFYLFGKESFMFHDYVISLSILYLIIIIMHKRYRYLFSHNICVLSHNVWVLQLHRREIVHISNISDTNMRHVRLTFFHILFLFWWMLK